MSPNYYPQVPVAGANAVNIQIFEPKAYAAPTVTQPTNMASQYNYPQTSLYNQGAQYPAPPMFTPPQYQPQYQQPQYQPQQQAYATQPPPQIMPNSVIPPTQTQEQTVNVNPTDEVATTATTEAAPVPMPAVEAPVPDAVDVIDVAKINSGLTSNDLDMQTAVITKLAQMSQDTTETADGRQIPSAIALQLAEPQIMQNLAAIIQRDTSQIPGPTKEQIEATTKLQSGKKLSPQETQLARQLAEQESPKETAEKNKAFAMFALAMIEKLQRDELDEFNLKAGEGAKIPPLKIEQLVGYNEIVNQIKTNPVPAVRASGIAAIGYVARPEDLATTQQLLMPLVNDQNETVKLAAQEVMTKIQAMNSTQG